MFRFISRWVSIIVVEVPFPTDQPTSEPTKSSEMEEPTSVRELVNVYVFKLTGLSSWPRAMPRSEWELNLPVRGLVRHAILSLVKRTWLDECLEIEPARLE